jgi:predicted nucleic acid-binding protein
MSAAARPLVLDANILVRAALGPRARGVVERHAADAGFFVPAFCVEEAREHLPAIVRKRGWSAARVMAALDAVQDMLQVVDVALYADAMDEALSRLVGRDADDAHVLALALTLNCPIWTEDRDFFGTGVATWKSAQVERYFVPSAS